MQSQSPTYNLVLPVNHLRHPLKCLKQLPRSQFLVGYRNVIVSVQGQPTWAFVKSQKHCGKGFIFEIPEQEALRIQQYRINGQILETSGTSYVLIQNQSEIVTYRALLSPDNVTRLLDMIGGPTTINLNIIKNAYNTFEEYQQQAGEAVNIFEERLRQEGVEEEKKRKQYENWDISLSGQSLKAVPAKGLEQGKENGQEKIVLSSL